MAPGGGGDGDGAPSDGGRRNCGARGVALEALDVLGPDEFTEQGEAILFQVGPVEGAKQTEPHPADRNKSSVKTERKLKY